MPESLKLLIYPKINIIPAANFALLILNYVSNVIFFFAIPLAAA